MSTWRTDENEVVPLDFVALLYNGEEVGSGDEGEPSGFGEECEYEIIDLLEDEDELRKREEDDLVRLSPVFRSSTPVDEEAPSLSTSRDRSRSPLLCSQESETSLAGCTIRFYDENLMELDEDGSFLAPDTHALYVSPEQRDLNERYTRSVSARRGGRRGVRGVRGQSARVPLGYSGNKGLKGCRWELGHPLVEICTRDEDVPLELVSLAMDVLRKRRARVLEAVKRDREDDSESTDDEEFLDASAGAADLSRLEADQFNFEWYPMESFQGEEEQFKVKRTGSVKFHNGPYDAFRSYWDDDVLNLIANETNLYATKIKAPAFQSEWYPTNIHEILCLFAFWMMLGILRMPTITSCFSADPLLKTEVFRRIFTRRRYEMLCRALHFVDSDPAVYDTKPSTSCARSNDRLHRLRPILTHLNSRFQSNYIMSQNISIDESLTLWKGRLKFKQYIRNKASKFGIKTFELCEATTGYLWSFVVYSGKQSATDLEQEPGVLKSTAVVKKLMGPLLNQGYRLFMDNWYNSPLLARYLKLNGTDCVGTLRSSCRDVPLVVSKAPLRRGEFIARHAGDVAILSWQDKKRVTMISTCHGATTALPTVTSRPPSRPVPFKPQMVLDYNKFMGGVDLKDQMLEPYLLERKRCAKWYMKLFKRLLNVSILNARTLLQSCSQKYENHLAFRLQLVDSILTNHLHHCPKGRRLTAQYNISTRDQPGRRVISTHWPVPLEPTESSKARNRGFTKRCVVCLREGRKSQKTPYSCESCGVPLCIKDCFKAYHTSP